jgi:hypothetical protein
MHQTVRRDGGCAQGGRAIKFAALIREHAWQAGNGLVKISFRSNE